MNKMRISITMGKRIICIDGVDSVSCSRGGVTVYRYDESEHGVMRFNGAKLTNCFVSRPPFVPVSQFIIDLAI